MSPNPPARPWTLAMEAFARRQSRIMLVAVVAWTALAVAQVLGMYYLWAQGWTVIFTPLRVVFPFRDTFSGAGCLTYQIDGLCSMLLAWGVVALLPLIVVPLRRSKTAPRADDALPSSPYRAPVVPAQVLVRAPVRRGLRRARRTLVAAAGASCLLIAAHHQVVILRFPFHAEVNGVALLDLVVAAVVVLAYVAAALRTDGPASPRA